MLKPAFYIQSDDIALEDPGQYRLLMEVNLHSFSYVLLNLRRMSPAVIKYYQFSHLKDQPLEESLREIIQGDELLGIGVTEIFLAYNVEDSNLVPDKFFGAGINKELTELINGNLEKGVILNEKIPGWELYNVYRIPRNVYDFLQQQFAGAVSWHAFSLLLKSHKMFTLKENQDCVRVVFYTDKMAVMVFKKNVLQLIRTFIYQDRKDVVYHLLNCCKQFNLDTWESALEISGLIDKQSVLFNELMKYFGYISFEEIDESIKVTDELREFPLHYFSSLVKMAVCV